MKSRLQALFSLFRFFTGIFGIRLAVESASGCGGRDTCLCQSFYCCSFRSLFRKRTGYFYSGFRFAGYSVGSDVDKSEA